MGILSDYEELEILKKILNKDYADFAKSLAFYHDRKEEANYLLKKFYNSFRMEAQKETKLKLINHTLLFSSSLLIISSVGFAYIEVV